MWGDEDEDEDVESEGDHDEEGRPVGEVAGVEVGNVNGFTNDSEVKEETGNAITVKRRAGVEGEDQVPSTPSKKSRMA